MKNCLLFIAVILMPLLSFADQSIFYGGKQEVYNGQGKKEPTLDFYTKIIYDQKKETIQVMSYYTGNPAKKNQAQVTKSNYARDSKGQWWAVLSADSVVRREKVDLTFKDKKLVGISTNLKTKDRYSFKYIAKFDNKVSAETVFSNPQGKIVKQYKASANYLDEATFNNKVSKLKVIATTQF